MHLKTHIMSTNNNQLQCFIEALHKRISGVVKRVFYD